MNRTKGTKRTHPKEANGTWTKVNKVHALFTSISSFGSSLFFIYWIKTKEKGVRSLTLFPLVFYSIKEQQRTQLISRLSSEWEWRLQKTKGKWKGKWGTSARLSFSFVLLCSSFGSWVGGVLFTCVGLFRASITNNPTTRNEHSTQPYLLMV